MPTQGRSGKPTSRRYSEQEKVQAVRLVRPLRAESGLITGRRRRQAALGRLTPIEYETITTTTATKAA